MQADRNALETPFEPRVVAPDRIEQEAVKGKHDGDGDQTDEDDIADEMPSEHDAQGLSCGDASAAGATVQKASLASPDTKEQFRLQASLGRH